MFENVLLEKEQEELLFTVVEAARNVPREQRQKFYVSSALGSLQSFLMHQGLPEGQILVYEGDVEILAHAGLLRLTYEGNSMSFDVMPSGFKYYEYLKQRTGQPVQRIEASIRNYLGGDFFQQKYAQGYQKWLSAETMLWSSDSEQRLTTIGHLCREAMQEFASDIVEQYQPQNVSQDKAHIVARIRAVLDLQSRQLGVTYKPFLDALLAYWGTVSDLIQRQEHGGQKEGQPLVWEDARCVVFQTAIVMFEISSGLLRSHAA
jgi:hypothetical protein